MNSFIIRVIRGKKTLCRLGCLHTAKLLIKFEF
jgi:hypothetical protein